MPSEGLSEVALFEVECGGVLEGGRAEPGGEFELVDGDGSCSD